MMDVLQGGRVFGFNTCNRRDGRLLRREAEKIVSRLGGNWELFCTRHSGDAGSGSAISFRFLFGHLLEIDEMHRCESFNSLQSSAFFGIWNDVICIGLQRLVPLPI